MGAETPTSNPYPVFNYVDNKWGEPLFIEGSDPFDYVSGLSIDGMPVSSSEFARRMNFVNVQISGSGIFAVLPTVPLGLGMLGVDLPTGWHGNDDEGIKFDWDSEVWDFSDIRDQGRGPQEPLTMKQATDVLKTRVGALINGKKGKDCKNLLDAILSQLHKNTGVAAIKNNFQDVFNHIAKKVGFSDDSGLYEDYGLTSLVGGRLAVGVNFSKAESSGPNSLGLIAIHETFHAAARQGLYEQYDIAKAAFDVGRRLGLVPDLVSKPIEGKSEAADKYNSQLFNQTVFTKCRER